MLVEFAFFRDDTLLERGAVRVTTEAQCAHLKQFHIAHQLVGDAAQIVLSNFGPETGLKMSRLEMPVHQSDDWETIQLATHLLVFRCALDA